MLNILGNLIHGLSVAVIGWRERQRALVELARLDDRSLADIGITRSEIPYVLSRAARRRELGAAANSNIQRAA
jgi:uncharacterized protein YjiS (DUF1127 family)